MRVSFIASLVILLLPATCLSATRADTLQARRYLSEALRACRNIPADDPYIKLRPLFPGTLPSAIRLQHLKAEARLTSWIDVVELQWQCGDSLEALRGVHELLKWHREHADSLHRSEDAIRLHLGYRLKNDGLEKLANRLRIKMPDPRPREAVPGVDTTNHGIWDKALSLIASKELEQAIRILDANVPDYQERLGAEAVNLAGQMTWENIQVLNKILPRESQKRHYILGNYALARSRENDWKAAVLAADSLPDDYHSKTSILSTIALGMLRGGDKQRAFETARRAIDLWRTSRDPRHWEDRGAANAAIVYVRGGDPDRAMDLLKELPEWARWDVYLELAGRMAQGGDGDSALALLGQAQKLQRRTPWPTYNPDQGLPEWITATADSGFDATALRAARILRHGMSRGSAYAAIARSQIRRGLVAEAEATIAMITQSPFSLADALAEWAVALAGRGETNRALAAIDRIAPEVEAQCRAPIDYTPSICMHPIPCPPIEQIFTSRADAFRGVGAKLARNDELQKVLKGLEPVDAAYLLIGAARERVRM